MSSTKTQGQHKATRETVIFLTAKERNLSNHKSSVTEFLLISFQIKSQLFAGNKDSQWGNQPPKGQMVSVQSPLTPPAHGLSVRAVCVLQARQATQQIQHVDFFYSWFKLTVYSVM